MGSGRECGGDLVEARPAGGLEEHHITGSEPGVQSLDGRGVVGQCHRSFSGAVGERPGADRKHHVGPEGGGLPDGGICFGRSAAY